MGCTLFRDPQVFSSTLASLVMLQPQAFGSLKSCRSLGHGIIGSVDSISRDGSDMAIMCNKFNISGAIES